MFRRDAGTWVTNETLALPRGSGKEQLAGYGAAIAISGTLLAVGAPFKEGRALSEGSVYIYSFVKGKWQLDATLQAPDADYGDLFGFSVALSGDVLAVGARDDEAGPLAKAGSAYIFRRSPKGWTFDAKLTSPYPEILGLFGGEISVSGNLLAVGARGEGRNAGRVHLYSDHGAGWTYETTLSSPGARSEAFGAAISIAPCTVAVGAFQDNVRGIDSGAIYVFDRSDIGWMNSATLTARDGHAGDWLGGTVAISQAGDMILAGAVRQGECGQEAGAIYAFGRHERRWTQVEKKCASDAAPFLGFGEAIALDVDGDSALVGAVAGVLPGRVYSLVGLKHRDCDGDGLTDPCAIFSGIARDDDRNGNPDSCDLLADLNSDGMVSGSDLAILLGAWGTEDLVADINKDGIVDPLDLDAMVLAWD
jgi:FG-GAP repeat